ncbi:MAG: RNA 2'-phosphotransferase [Thermoplasmata archaeon]|nr:MAG: RNA 2'-phosphotransferase [Thermoplasmata archaeon]
MDIKTRVSKLMSYLLRHMPDGLDMDRRGFVRIDDLLRRIRDRYPGVDKELLMEIVEKSERKRFEIKGDRIRALYGHSIQVNLDFEEDRDIKTLFHGTTERYARKILKEGLKPMGRKWVHLSTSIEIAREVGKRRTKEPVILKIDAEKARKEGIKFYRATEEVYLCRYVPPKFISRLS